MSDQNNKSTNKSNLKKRSQSVGGIDRRTSLLRQAGNPPGRGSVPCMSDNDQVPIVISREEAIIKLKSILKTDSQRLEEKALEEKKKTMNEPPSTMRGRFNSIEQSGSRPSAGSVGIRFSQMVNLREYDGELAPDTVRSTKQQPIYRTLNFRTDENDLIVDSSPSDSKTNKPVKKVQLESFKITRHHLNGCIKAKSMSLDQQCYIRITTDNWVTFQETEAIDTGDESSPMLTKYHFDFIIPIPRHDKSDKDPTSILSNTNNNINNSTNNSIVQFHSASTNSNTNNNTNQISTSQTSLQSSTSMLRNLTMTGSPSSSNSTFSIKDCPTGLEFFVVLKSLGMLYIDDNEKLKYKLKLITPRASVVPVIALASGIISTDSISPSISDSSTN